MRGAASRHLYDTKADSSVVLIPGGSGAVYVPTGHILYSAADGGVFAVPSWKSGKADTSARIVFATPELLWKVLTAKRWEILKTLCGVGEISIREATRRVERDVKAVHSDVTALLNAGILERTETGGIVFPFDAVQVEFTLRAA